MRAWLAALLLLLPSSIWAQASWIQLGDPQFGQVCGSVYASGYTGPNPTYADMGPDECLERQERQLRGIMEYGVAKNVDFFVFMGDENNPFGTNRDPTSPTRTVFGEVLDDYTGETIYFTAGNHDTENNCAHLEKFILNHGNQAPAVRNPLWGTWTINNVYFANLPAPILGGTGVGFDCIAGDTNACTLIDGSAGPTGACVSNADPLMVGQTTACNAVTEMCNDLSGYQTDSWSAIQTFLNSWAVASTADNRIRLFTFSHWPPWFDDDDVSAGEFDTVYRRGISTAVAAGFTSATKPFIMQYGHWHENTVLGTSLSSYWDSNQDPTITGVNYDGVTFTAVAATGHTRGKYREFGLPAYQEKMQTSAFYWKVDRDGNHTVTRVLASPQWGGYR